MPTQMGATHAAGLVEMRERALDPLAALPHQSAAASSPHPTSIAIHGRLRRRLLRPVAATPVRLRYIGTDAHGFEVDHALVAVVPLIANDLFKGLRLIHRRLCRFDLFG